MDSIEGKVALVTGAGRGAGRTAARLLAQHGAQVAANDISPVNLDELVQEGGGRIRAYAEDIAKKVGVQAVVKQVEDDFGRIDILVNHAAVDPHASLLEIDEWDWHRVLDVNLTGTFLMMQSVGRMMRAAGAGHIINLINLDPSAHPSAAYSASMYGVIALTQAAAAELGPAGVLVNAVGKGLPSKEVNPSIPRSLGDAMLYLCTASVNGQVVRLEET